MTLLLGLIKMGAHELMVWIGEKVDWVKAVKWLLAMQD